MTASSWTVAHQATPSWDSPGKDTGVGSHSLLQGIFLTQGSNLSPLDCWQIIYHLSHQGSLDIDNGAFFRGNCDLNFLRTVSVRKLCQ